MTRATPATARSTKLGPVTIPANDRPAGYGYLAAREETATRICVVFQLEGWTQPECDVFGRWTDAYAAHPALVEL